MKMQRRRMILLLSALFIVILIGILVKNHITKDTDFNPMITTSNETIKLDFNTPLTRLDETGTTLEDYKGKILIINFWASWCGPCQKEAPHLKAFYDNMPDNVELLAINITSSEIRKNIEKFIDLYDLKFPIFLDLDKSLEKSFKVLTYPTTFIVDSDGTLKYTIKGPIDENELKKLIANL
ncbi:TlpA family protein disulfide reductase [Ureibacillus sp. Re31]|uniref:TlpA family protein disulfide reductase n=1 Tax=Ureibacillus galli TaxID=2762222 RepID=A0ABR8XGN9_9BACL|nr:TlpA disulfide reductase family protein [Ureibacillus galli]MBD8028394.1 TlpA family protein disulfide reductase [Ureibacillus galli]